MNRRRLLALIGFAPLATAAAALPRVADPVKLASTGGREVRLKELSETLGNVDITDAHTGGLIVTDELYISSVVDDVNRRVTEHIEWIDTRSRECTGMIKRIDILNR